jgi:hypothetical protein
MSKYKNFKEGILKLFDFQILLNIFPTLKGLKRKTLKNRLFYLSSFPKEAPPIAKLLEIFGKISKEKKIGKLISLFSTIT